MHRSRVIAAAAGLGALTALAACQPRPDDQTLTLDDGTELAVADAADVGMGDLGLGRGGGVVETDRPSAPAEQSLAASCPANPAQMAAMADAVNAVRRIEGKVLLVPDAGLDGVAQSQACDMLRMGQATVAGSNGSNVVDRARAIGYPTCGVIQLAQVGGAPAAVVNAWLASPPHREQVLGQLSDEIGVGVATGADGRQWWSVVIGDNCR